MPDGEGPQPQATRQSNGMRVYRICCFEPGAVVPSVQLISAHSDEQAIAAASGVDPFAEREVWDFYRLVAHLPGEGMRARMAALAEEGAGAA